MIFHHPPSISWDSSRRPTRKAGLPPTSAVSWQPSQSIDPDPAPLPWPSTSSPRRKWSRSLRFSLSTLPATLLLALSFFGLIFPLPPLPVHAAEEHEERSEPTIVDPLTVFQQLVASIENAPKASGNRIHPREICQFGLGPSSARFSHFFLGVYPDAILHLFDVTDFDLLLELKQTWNDRVFFGADYLEWERQKKNISCSVVLFSADGPKFTLERVMENIHDEWVTFLFLSHGCATENSEDAKAEGEIVMSGRTSSVWFSSKVKMRTSFSWTIATVLYFYPHTARTFNK